MHVCMNCLCLSIGRREYVNERLILYMRNGIRWLSLWHTYKITYECRSLNYPHSVLHKKKSWLVVLCVYWLLLNVSITKTRPSSLGFLAPIPKCWSHESRFQDFFSNTIRLFSLSDQMPLALAKSLIKIPFERIHLKCW